MKTIRLYTHGTPEHDRLMQAAKLMTAKSPNGWRYFVENCWYDLGRDWAWTTIVCQRDEDTTCQALYPYMHEQIIEADDLEAAVNDYFADEHCSDQAHRYVVTYIAGQVGETVVTQTHYAVMARNETMARLKFAAEMPGKVIVRMEEIDDAREAFERYGMGAWTDAEREAHRETLRQQYEKTGEERKEAELEARTYDLDELAAVILHAKKRAAEPTQNLEGVHVGDLYYVEWGYDQTNYNFFQVVGLRGKHTVVMREVKALMAPYGNMCGVSRPVRNGFLGETRYTMRTRYDERLKRVWINAPEGFGSGHGLNPCNDGKLFDYTCYA